MKAADVGLAMGITGTKVAQAASDIVILDDRFSSIVRAILWGRSIYDNIRKFLQFQLTVNGVALTLVFIGAVTGLGTPLNAVQMLWVNLVMDTLGALALATEMPTPNLLERKPYNRSAKLISLPMWRNIICQAAFQLLILFLLLFAGPQILKIKSGVSCFKYSISSSQSSLKWDPTTGQKTEDAAAGIIKCTSFEEYCPRRDQSCLETYHHILDGSGVSESFSFENLSGFTNSCLKCIKNDYTHGTIVFNSFIFCQIFNEYSSRMLFNELNMFRGLHSNSLFLYVSLFTIGIQIFLVQIGGDFVKTTGLSLHNWLISIAFGKL